MEPFPGDRSVQCRGSDLILRTGDPRNLPQKEMSKALPEGLEVLGCPRGEGFLAWVYLRDCAFDVAQCLLVRRKGEPEVLYWRWVYSLPTAAGGFSRQPHCKV